MRSGVTVCVFRLLRRGVNSSVRSAKKKAQPSLSARPKTARQGRQLPSSLRASRASFEYWNSPAVTFLAICWKTACSDRANRPAAGLPFKKPLRQPNGCERPSLAIAINLASRRRTRSKAEVRISWAPSLKGGAGFALACGYKDVAGSNGAVGRRSRQRRLTLRPMALKERISSWESCGTGRAFLSLLSPSFLTGLG